MGPAAVALLAGTLAATALGLVGCTHRAPLPSASRLLGDSSRAMARVATVHFVLQVSGPLGGFLPIRRAEGDLTRGGDAAATALIEQSGNLVEYHLVVVRRTFYLQGATGGFQTLPAPIAAAFYDPSRLLDPSSGIPNMLRTATSARTVASGSVNGVAAYEVDARVGTGVFEHLLPLPATVPAQLWIAAGSARLLRAILSLSTTGSGGSGATELTLTLSRFDAPVAIRPPG